MTEVICYALIWIAYSLLLFLHMTHALHGLFDHPPAPPALPTPPAMAGSVTG